MIRNKFQQINKCTCDKKSYYNISIVIYKRYKLNEMATPFRDAWNVFGSY